MKAFSFFSVFLVSSAMAFAGVSVSSPINGSTSGSPVHFVATASASHPISAITVYVDNKAAYSANASSIDTNVSMSAGSHYVVVQAWDTLGTVYKAAPITLTVSSGIPSNATVYSNIDEMTGWDACDTCAGSGGNGPTAQISMTQFIASPAMDGKSARFYMAGSKAYSSALWWKQLGGNASASNFVYDLYFYVKNPAAVQALEFDANQSVGGKKYIFGTQCDVLGHHDWDVWDTANHAWVQTGIACAAPAAYTWNHLILEFQRVNGQAKFVSVTLNGTKSYINKAFWPKASSVSELNTAFQMDGNSQNTAYSTWLDKINLSVW